MLENGNDRRGLSTTDDDQEYLLLTSRVYREGEHWIAEAIQLGVSTFADTPEAATEALSDAVDVYLQTLEDEGIFAAVIRDRRVPKLSGADLGQTSKMELLSKRSLSSGRASPSALLQR